MDPITMDAGTETMRRVPGRPRSSAADEAILEATVDVFAEVGLEALTMEGVAARAGVGKNTLYRRYPNKLDLVVSAVRCYTNVGAAPPDTGTTRGDVQAIVEDLVAIVDRTPMGRMLPILIAARTRAPSSTSPTPRSWPTSGRAARQWCAAASSAATSVPTSTSRRWSTPSPAPSSTGSSSPTRRSTMRSAPEWSTPRCVRSGRRSQVVDRAPVGDALIPDAEMVFDRRARFAAVPDEVWPWVVQLGKHRAGWYLPRCFERWIPARHRAARVLEAEWQQLAVGDVVDDYGGRNETLTVVHLERPHALVFRAERLGTCFTWALLLTPAVTAPSCTSGSEVGSAAAAGVSGRSWSRATCSTG